MVLNSLKKILLFSSVKSKKLIETMADDESTCTKIKSSAILESRLVDSFLTENDQIRFWILNLYNGDTSGKILSSVFAYNSSGINWKSQGLPVLPFIEFAINEQKYINKYKADKLDNRNQVKIKKISMIFHGFYCTLKIPEEKALFFRVV